MKKISHNYFKHANNATYGGSIQNLIQKRQYRAVCLYWFILERLSDQNSGDKLVLNPAHIAKSLNTNLTGIQHDLNTISAQVGSICWGFMGDLCWIEVSNFSELQGRRVDTRQDKTRQEEKRQPVFSSVVAKLESGPPKNQPKKDALAAPVLSPSVTRGDPVNGISAIELEQCFYQGLSEGYSQEFMNQAYDEYLIWALDKGQLIAPSRFLGWLRSDITRAKWKKVAKEHKDRARLKEILAKWEADCPGQKLTREEAMQDPADVTIRL